MNKYLLTGFSLIFTFIFFTESKVEAYNYINLTPPGDTIEFNASNYVIQPNDKLQDLLRRLPVITIDQKGTIYAQNDTIKSLLVDGKEFFNEDPSVAAPVLRADKVDKIKIYWRWTDQASFTGIEDRARIKTINIIMKIEK